MTKPATSEYPISLRVPRYAEKLDGTVTVHAAGTVSFRSKHPEETPAT